MEHFSLVAVGTDIVAAAAGAVVAVGPTPSPVVHLAAAGLACSSAAAGPCRRGVALFRAPGAIHI